MMADRDRALLGTRSNETWLVLGGGGLFAAFPGFLRRADAGALPAGGADAAGVWILQVASPFEFRARGRQARQAALDAILFAAGSIVAALAQGLVLGGFVHGINLRDGEFVGGAFDWATPYAALTALGLVAGYALLGAGWLMIKTRDELHGDARRWARMAAILVAALLAVVSVATLVVEPHVAARWGWTGSGFEVMRLVRLSPIPILGAAGLAILAAGLIRGSHVWPFVGAVVVFLSGYLGLAASFFPYVAPYQLTFRDAANDPRALALLFGGLVFILPVILGYTVWVYWVFRGKTSADAGYH